MLAEPVLRARAGMAKAARQRVRIAAKSPGALVGPHGGRKAFLRGEERKLLPRGDEGFEAVAGERAGAAFVLALACGARGVVLDAGAAAFEHEGRDAARSRRGEVERSARTERVADEVALR